MNIYALFFVAGGLVGALITVWVLRLLRAKPVKTRHAKGEKLKSQPVQAESTEATQESIADLNERRLEVEAQIRDQRTATRARRAIERNAAEESARVEAQRLAAEEAARVEALRLAAEEAARVEAQRLAAEEAARIEAQRLAAEEAARIDGQRLAAEESARVKAQQLAAEESARVEAQRLAAEESARVEAQQLAAEESARVEAQQLAAEESARVEAQRLAAEEAARIDGQRLAAEESARVEAQRLVAEEAARVEAQRLAAENDAKVAAEKPTTPKSPADTLVMIVDDSKVGRVKTNRLLLSNQFQSQMAEDGRDAVHKIAARMPDIIITDVEMPEMDGFELTKYIRQNPATAHLPVIIISGNKEEYASRAKEAGADFILGKPYTDSELIEQVRLYMRSGR